MVCIVVNLVWNILLQITKNKYNLCSSKPECVTTPITLSLILLNSADLFPEMIARNIKLKNSVLSHKQILSLICHMSLNTFLPTAIIYS